MLMKGNRQLRGILGQVEQRERKFWRLKSKDEEVGWEKVTGGSGGRGGVTPIPHFFGSYDPLDG